MPVNIAELANLNIRLGGGYQSVAGTGVKAIAPVDERELPQEDICKFAYAAKFFESSSDLQKELNVSIGISGNIYNVAPEIKGNFNKIIKNNNCASYYMIELTWKKFCKNYVPEQSSTLDSMLTNIGKFYQEYGDKIITKIIYGQKLIVIIEIAKSMQSKIVKWSGISSLSVPVTTASTIKAQAEIASALSALHDANVADIHIISLGNNNSNLHMDAIDNIVELRKKLLTMLINDFPTAAINTGDKSLTDTQNIQPSTHVISHINQPNETINIYLKPSKNLSTQSLQTDNNSISIEDKNYAPIAIITSRYATNNANYEKILACTDRTNEFSKWIYRCESRAKSFSNQINYMLNNPEPFSLTHEKTMCIEMIKHDLNKRVKKLKALSKILNNNIFSEEIFSEGKNMKKWEHVWEEIRNVIIFLNNLKSDFIDFYRFSFLIGEFSSSLTHEWHSIIHKRSSKYISLKVPFETEYLRFDVISDQKGFPIDDLQFNLIRKFYYHANGHKHSHRTLHTSLGHGSRVTPLVPNMEQIINQVHQKKIKISQDFRQILSNKYNRQPYNRVAIANPRLSEKNDLYKNARFKVKVYAQTKSTVLEPLPLKDMACDSIIDEVTVPPSSSALPPSQAPSHQQQLPPSINIPWTSNPHGSHLSHGFFNEHPSSRNTSHYLSNGDSYISLSASSLHQYQQSTSTAENVSLASNSCNENLSNKFSMWASLPPGQLKIPKLNRINTDIKKFELTQQSKITTPTATTLVGDETVNNLSTTPRYYKNVNNFLKY